MFFIVLFFVLQTPCRAQQYDFTPTLQKAYGAILQLHYSEAEALVEAQLKLTPNHAIGLYLKNFNTILPVFILEDKAAYHKLAKQEKTTLDLIGKLPVNSPYYYFVQAEIKLHWSLLKLKFGDYTASGLNVRSAYKILEEGLQKYPDFVPMKKSMALLKIIIGSIPGSYTWVSELAGLHGNLNSGLQELTEVANGVTIYHAEAKLWLILCEHYLLGKTDHLEALFSLRKSNPYNVLYCFLEVSLLMHDSQSEKALALYNNKPLEAPAFSLIPALHYMLGEIYLQKGLYSQAIASFQQYIQSYKGQSLIKDTYYKISLAYWLQGNDKEAKRYKALTLSKGNTRNDSDKQAQKMAEATQLPDQNIYKIRLMTDGGYFKEAIALSEKLDKESFNNPKDKIEYPYRKGRLFHKYGDVEQAILFYQQTIAASGKTEDYFAPNACLQLGYIYRNLDQSDKARAFFQKVFEYKHYQYEETIESKAKAGLSSLEK